MGNFISVSLSCGDAILSRCLDSLLPRAAYVRKLQDNLGALKTSLVDLTSSKNDVNTRVENAERQSNMKRLEKVDRWIKSVETIETRVSQLVSDSDQEIEKLCCGGCCSKAYLSSYKYGKTVAKALAEVKDLENKGKFEEVAEESFGSAQERPSEPTVGMDSMLDKAWKHVEDEEVGIIGLYGMGGVGKTTLLNQIHNKFLNSTPRNDFNPVIWIVVSKDHKLGIVQDKIGEKIGLFNGRWKDKELEGKAEDIHRVLTKKKFVLLLDDIWEPVDITKIGVPIPDKRNKSKIIFTTRSEDVCSHMDAQKKVKVECLQWEYAWNLFQEKVGKEILYGNPDIPKLAESVAKECDGLPLALKVVGRAMACKKKPEEWKYALDNLKKSSAEFSGTGNEVFTRLKYSYDNLSYEKLRSCFLYCALFPEDFPISKEKLLYFWMCEDILDDEYGNVDQAKNEAYYIIGTLVNACLLEDAWRGDYVKMHDVVRDMALWVARDCGKENDRVLVYAADHGTPDVKRWKSTTNRVSFSTTNFERLVETPNSPNLLTLFITPSTAHLHWNSLTEIVDGFFNYMPRLQVLDLSRNKRLARLPSGISNLLSLQYLNLAHSGIRELPLELKACVRLKYLNLDFTEHIDVVPRNIISSFKMLKVLRMGECGSGDKILFDGEEALIEEIQGLKHLDAFEFSVRSTSCFQKVWSYHTLVKCTRALYMSDSKNKSTTVLDISSLVDMEHLSVLRIHDYPKLEVMKISCAGRVPTNYPHKSMMKNQISLLGLQNVYVTSCPNLKDLTWLIFAPKLSSLFVMSCSEMEKITALEKLGGEENVVREPSPFGKLRSLNLRNLPVLKSVYDSALPFPYLDWIEVRGCPELRKLPLNSTSAQNRKVIIEGEESWWNGLEWEDQVSRDAILPGFTAASSVASSPASSPPSSPTPSAT